MDRLECFIQTISKLVPPCLNVVNDSGRILLAFLDALFVFRNLKIAGLEFLHHDEHFILDFGARLLVVFDFGAQSIVLLARGRFIQLFFVLGDYLLLRLEADFLVMQAYLEFLDGTLSLVEEFLQFGGLFLVGFDGLWAAIDLGSQILGVAVQAM